MTAKMEKNKAHARNIGVLVEIPNQICNDNKCPFHGKLSVRGKRFEVTVISTKMRRTAVIEFKRLNFLRKYERYEKRKTKLKVHNPDCIGAVDGDIVEIMECRPLSKTKKFVIIAKLGIEKGFMERMEALHAAKFEKQEMEEVKTEEK